VRPLAEGLEAEQIDFAQFEQDNPFCIRGLARADRRRRRAQTSLLPQMENFDDKNPGGSLSSGPAAWRSERRSNARDSTAQPGRSKALAGGMCFQATPPRCPAVCLMPVRRLEWRVCAFASEHGRRPQGPKPLGERHFDIGAEAPTP
jgi:hypothetical protein